ncbi:hypothetical protein TRFO_19403 [Tritrichomonas foetus]|uniref:Importin N-terminal domain-containing protein n=1 Tax=Tritrichomonas foetus TaxID=1144522 RepID=A0A1J4KIX7_9EUKA|nr:hypothetical protein TRFO_19403 [Tritrichomonas foetus]|eukprot:OHT11287.1 hypothetical protein TRFO_19403 [Tritrichomonas foetus]
MDQQIIHLLEQTRSNNSELIAQAEKSLTELSTNPEFLPTLITIPSNVQISDVIRLSALIHIRIVVDHFWETSVDESIKQLIKSSLPEIILNWPLNLIQNVHHYAHSVIRAAFPKGEWPELPNIIFSLLSHPTENTVRAGLILASSLCGSVKIVNQNDHQLRSLVVEFGVSLLNVLMSLFSQCQVFEFLSLGFHCASRILLSNAGFPFENLTNNFLPLVEKSCIISQVVENEDYVNLAIHSLKFAIQFVTKYAKVLPVNIIGQYVQLINTLIPTNVPPKIKVLLLSLLNELFKCPNTWPLFADNLPNFLAQLMMPLFALSQDNIISLNSDPAEFIADVHKSDNHFEDIRSSASTVIYSLHEHIEIVNAARIVAVEAFISYSNLPQKDLNSQIVLFAAFQMFSSVSRFMKDIDPLLFTKFFTTIFPLFDSPEELGRAAGFMLLSESTNVTAPPELIMKCIEHIVDPFPLARYYAVISAAGLLENTKEVSLIQKHFAKSPAIPAMFTSLFELSQRFQFSDIANAISGLIKIFNVHLLPIAANVGHGLLQFLANSIDSIETAQGIICDSLEFLVDLISQNEEARIHLAPQLCTEAFTVLTNIEQTEIFDLLASTTIRLFEMSPFSPTMWNAANMLIDRIRKDPDVSITDLVAIISLFVYKDTEFAMRENMPIIVTFCMEQMNERTKEFDSWVEFAKLASHILLRLTNSNPSVINLIKPLTEMASIMIESDQLYYSSITGLVMLINSLMMTDLQTVINVLGSKFDQFIEFWTDNAIFPETTQTFMVCMNFLSTNSDLFINTLLKVSASIFDDVMLRTEDDEFDEAAECETSCIWFDFKDTLLKFHSLLHGLSQSNPTLYQRYTEEMPSEWNQQIGMIPVFAERYSK